MAGLVGLAVLGLVVRSSGLSIQHPSADGLRKGKDANNVSSLRTELAMIKEWNSEHSSKHQSLRRSCQPQAERLAMIISGVEPRLLLKSKIENVVKPLAEQGVGVDLYVDVVDRLVPVGAQWTRVAAVATESDDAAYMKKALGKFMDNHCGSLSVNRRKSKEELTIPKGSRPGWEYPIETIKNVFRRYSSFKGVMEQIAEREEEGHFKYGFVLVTRDDDDWLGKLDLDRLTQNFGFKQGAASAETKNVMFSKACKEWNGFNDSTLLFGRDAADKILGKMFDYMMDNTIQHPGRNAERYFKQFVQGHTSAEVRKVPFEYLPTTRGVLVLEQRTPVLCHKRQYTCKEAEDNSELWKLQLCPEDEQHSALTYPA